MESIFEMVTETGKREKKEISVSIGIRLKVGGHETTCPISRACHSYETLEMEVQAIKNSLDSLLAEAKRVIGESEADEGLDLRSDMAPEEIWSILSAVSDEDLFIKSFNNLDENKRKEVAEYVLTQCNIFSGKASVFSSRYDNETGLME
ncbi:MAG: hypothetical protein PVH99_15790 [Desulfobacteraceae bacterium]|jgi:hypothetical protein